ncbi:MAG: SHOCT domain-containing protein [Desulfamplus sp.]|nr:SHOCT domain-containing protein [Desulfamplus sp.]
MKFIPTDKEGVLKSLFAAYFVLLLHVFLVAGVGITVVLFKGVYQYLPWIMTGIAALVIALFWIFYLRIKRSSTDIKDVLSHPAFYNRSVEIKLLGGVATFKLGTPVGSLPPGDQIRLLDQNKPIGQDEESVNRYQTSRLESGHTNFESGHTNIELGHTNIERRLSELAGLYKKNLIDDEEYSMAKKRILFESGIDSENDD